MWLVIDEPRLGLAIHRATLADWFSSRVRAGTLDRELAAGASPDGSAPRALRAAYLVRPGTRRLLARSLASALAEATGPSQLRLGCRVPVVRRNVMAAREPLQAVSARLRSGGPVSAQGMARLAILLRDGCGPLYHSGSPVDLGWLLRDLLSDLALRDLA